MKYLLFVLLVSCGPSCLEYDILSVIEIADGDCYRGVCPVRLSNGKIEYQRDPKIGQKVKTCVLTEKE